MEQITKFTIYYVLLIIITNNGEIPNVHIHNNKETQDNLIKHKHLSIHYNNNNTYKITYNSSHILF